MSTFAVVVVNHNAGGELIDCLHSIREQNPAEIVVIDNASTDGSTEVFDAIFPTVRLVRNERNTGFAAAANQGVRLSSTSYVLLLNPDAKLQPGALDALRRSLDAHPKAAVVGALVKNPDGTVQPTKRKFPTLRESFWHGIVGIFRPDNPGTRAYLLTDAEMHHGRSVDWVAGTAMALRREAFDSVGGFDEAYFFFVEDVDLCKRLSDAGWEVRFEPGAEVVHVWGRSWTQRPLRFLWMHQWNLFRYVRKHRKGLWVLAYPVIALGLLVRFTLLALRWVITKRSVPKHRSSGGNA